MRDHFGNNMLSSDLAFAKGIKILDDCEGTCNWLKSADDANATVTYETVAAWTGTKGLQLYSGNDSAAANDEVQAYKLCDLSESGIIVFRSKICMPDVSEVDQLIIDIIIYDGTKIYTGQLLYKPNEPKVYYLNSAGTFTEITEMAFGSTDGCWFTMELVIDQLAKQYIQVSCFGITVDLSGVDMLDGGATTDHYMAFSIRTWATAEAPSTIYADSIYLGEYINI